MVDAMNDKICKAVIAMWSLATILDFMGLLYVQLTVASYSYFIVV